ncbi:MAG TPA: cytochrome P450 [Streptosporangiaceae bacterium]|nr:cytochrome P450 [Streptosporangiaceae bacterium]
MAELVGDLELAEFDFTSAELSGDSYHERLAAVREHGWLVKSPISYVVLDRESGEFFLRARQTAFPGKEIAGLFGITGGRLAEQIEANILNLTGDRHRRIRALVAPAFTPRAGEQWRPVMRQIAADLWDAFGDAGECEFVSAFAGPYPARTIAEVIGAPQEDARELQEWSSWVQKQFDIKALAEQPQRIEQATGELYDYVARLLDRRRKAPAGDLISTLLKAEDEGDRLSPAECVNLVLNVLAGGVDTTVAQLAHGLRLFARHPDQWAMLAERPELVRRAVEEVLRFEPITPFTARVCTDQIEHRGVIFPAGTIVAICSERANREIDGGDDFDISAERAGQRAGQGAGERALTFGAGPHFCLGQSLARAELEEAFGFLAPRMPALRAAGPAELGNVEGIYGIDSLPLAWA